MMESFGLGTVQIFGTLGVVVLVVAGLLFLFDQIDPGPNERFDD